MTAKDASFTDGQEKPVNIAARDPDDLQVISAMVQDAVFPSVEMRWIAKARQFAVLVNRFRWELNASVATKPERVQSVLAIENVLSVASQGIDRSDKETVYSVLSVTFEGDADAGGYATVTLAGDGAIRLKVEALEVRLKDVTRPYNAPSGSIPRHAD